MTLQLMVEFGENCFTKFCGAASQGNTPKGVFLREGFIPIFGAPFKYFVIDQTIKKTRPENRVLHPALY
jgi:hypothetical protein